MPVRIVDSAAFGSPPSRPLRAAPSAFQLPTISSRSETSRSDAAARYCGAAVAIAAGAVGGVVVGVGPLAGARAGAVQVLAPQQELDGVVAGRHIGLVVAGFLQRARQQLRRDLRGIDLGAVDLDRRIGDDVGRIEGVLVRLRAVAAGRHSRSALRRAARSSPGLPSRRRSHCRSDRPRSAGRAGGPPSMPRAPRSACRPTAWRSARRPPGRAAWRSSSESSYLASAMSA